MFIWIYVYLLYTTPVLGNRTLVMDRSYKARGIWNIIALIVGLLIGNFAKEFAEKLKEVAKPE